MMTKLGDIQVGDSSWYYDMQLRWLRNPSIGETVDCDDIQSATDLGAVIARLSAKSVDDVDFSGFLIGLDLACEIVFEAPLSEVFSSPSSRVSWEHGTYG